jgi:lambda family phage tail tape measure protein
MAEKRISVRLSAEGGKQVRAELTGIGTAGAEGFGRVSREAEAANARLAAFARRAGVVAAAMASAAAAAGVALIRSGLQGVDAQAKLAQSMDTTVASIQTLTWAGELAGVSLGEIEQAAGMLTRRLSEAATGTGSAVAALGKLHLAAKDLQALPLDERIAAIQDALVAYVPEAERAAVASDLFGDRASLVFTRIDTATLRQASTDVRAFGVVVSQTDAAQIERTNDAIARLGLLGQGLANQLAVAAAPALEALADAMARLAAVTGPVGGAINTLLDNLDRFAAYAGAAAVALSLRMTPAVIAGALAVARLTQALVLTRAALIRTGWGAAVVLAGELAYRIGQMGEAADASSEAQTRMNEALGLYAQVGGPNARAEAIAATQAYVNEAAAKLESAEASLAIARARREEHAANADLRGADLLAAAAGPMGGMDAVVTEAGLAGAIAATEKLQAELAAARVRLKELETSDPAAPLVVAANAAASLSGQLAGATTRATRLTQALGKAPEALASLQDQAAVISAGLNAAAMGYDRLGISAAQYRAGLEREYGLAQLTHYEQRQLVQEQIDARVALYEANQRRQAQLDAYLAGLEALPAAEAAAGGAAVAAAEQAATGWAAVTQALGDYATTAMDWGKGLGDTLSRAFQSAESAFRSFAMTGKLDFKGLVQSILADLATLAFKSAVLGPIAKWLGGAFPTLFAPVSHAGGMVGAAGPTRAVPAFAFAGAPRLHSGGWAGLAPDEVPTILQRGERVLSRREVAAGIGAGAGGSGVSISIDARGAVAGVAEQIDAKLRAALPEIARIAKASVADGRRRGHAL